jgi:hypothetical protein
MEKNLARDRVNAEWRYAEACGDLRIYPSQSSKAQEVCDAFWNGAALVTLIASPQWGKTGVALDVMYRMTTCAENAVHPNNVYMVTGMSDKDWVEQTQRRVLPIFRERVVHRNRLSRLSFDGITDALIIIDECHYGSEVAQTMHKCLRKSQVWDIDYMRKNNIKILSISATPVNVLIDSLSWSEDNHRMIIARCDDAAEYVGFHTLLREMRVRNVRAQEDGFLDRILEDIEARWPRERRWHIIRAPPTMLRKHDLVDVLKARGYACTFHNSKQRIRNIDAILREAPSQHHFIFIKQFWKAAKTLHDEHIGVCLEVTKDATQAAQGLGGRLLGFGKQRGDAAPVLYCNAEAIQSYVRWLDYDCNYFMCKKYCSSALKIKDGIIQKAKQSAMHADHVANLEGVPPSRGLPRYNMGNVVPKKIGVVREVPEGVRLVTKLETLSPSQFAERFGMTGAIPEDAVGLSKMLKSMGVRANVSFSKNAAASRSNLVNYYTHRNWSEDEYHISRVEADTFVVIWRDKRVLDSVRDGDEVVSHNHVGQLVLYRF